MKRKSKEFCFNGESVFKELDEIFYIIVFLELTLTILTRINENLQFKLWNFRIFQEKPNLKKRIQIPATWLWEFETKLKGFLFTENRKTAVASSILNSLYLAKLVRYILDWTLIILTKTSEKSRKICWIRLHLFS